MSKIKETDIRIGNVIYNETNDSKEVVRGIWQTADTKEYWVSNEKGGYCQINARSAMPVTKEYVDHVFNKMSEYAVFTDKFIAGIKYMHQLQNLYFSITGKELV